MRDAPTRSRPMGGQPPACLDGRTLEVYVSRHCPNCGEALRLADETAGRFPSIVVRVIDLDLHPTPVPEIIVAVPTYVLDGRLISLGNPDPEELFARLHEADG